MSEANLKKGKTVPFIYHEIRMEAARRKRNHILIGWAVSAASLVGVILYLLIS